MTPKEMAKAKARLAKAAKGSPVGQEALDEIVCDIKSEEASQINNQGIDEQVNFILESDGAGGVEVIERALGLNAKPGSR